MKINNPWLIAGIGCLILLVSNGMIISGLSVFDESILNEFGWDRGQLKFGSMITFSVGALLSPFGGVILDRIGVKKCLLVGWVLLLLAYFSYGYIESLTHLYILHAVFGLVLVLCGLNPAIILVSSWFKTKRGVAIGITLIGSSLGGVLFPQYGTAMINSVGWRESFQWAAIFPVLMLFVVLLLVKDHPDDTQADQSQVNNDNKEQAGSLTYKEAVRTRAFWALTLIAMTTFYTVLAMQAHLFLFLRDLEITAATATNAISAFFICATIGKLIFGYLADVVHFKKVFIGNITVMLIGTICLALMNTSLIWVAIVLFGLGWGGVYTTIQLSAVNCFGLTSAGKILGTIAILDCIGGGLGIWLTGVFYTQYGNYQMAFSVFIVLVTIALVLIPQIKQPSRITA